MSEPMTHANAINHCLGELTEEIKNFAMLMHLSQFATFILPGIGLFVPIILWAMKREHPFVDQQGKLIFNWMISASIYGIGLAVFIFVVPFLAFPLLLLLAVCSIIFTILAAIAAKQGQLSAYPLAIPFFK